jgi:hypothetical protein
LTNIYAPYVLSTPDTSGDWENAHTVVLILMQVGLPTAFLHTTVYIALHRDLLMVHTNGDVVKDSNCPLEIGK